MAEEEKKLELVATEVTTGMGLAMPIGDYYSGLVEAEQKIADAKSRFRAALLKAMVDHDVCNFTLLDKYQFVKKGGEKVEEEFDSAKFMAEANADIIEAFTTSETQETVDINRLLEDNPELKAKYTIKTTTVTVDTKGLKKNMPNLYDKYTTKKTIYKEPSLMVREVAEKKTKKEN